MVMMVKRSCNLDTGLKAHSRCSSRGHRAGLTDCIEAGGKQKGVQGHGRHRCSRCIL
jgi:hypothetical protein